MRDLGQHAAAVAEATDRRPTAPRWSRLTRICKALFENVVRLAVLHVGHKANAAGIMLLGRIVEGLGGRHQRVRTESGLRRLAVRRFERRLGCGVHLSAPRAVADFVRLSFRIFRRIVDKGGCVARSPKALRVGFFSIRLCRSIRQRSRPRSRDGAEALASPHKKWSAQLSYYADHDRNGSSTQAVGARFFRRFDPAPEGIATRARLDANCGAPILREQP